MAVTTAELLANDVDPQGGLLTVVSVSEPGTDGTLTGDLTNGFTLHTQQRPEPRSTPITN